MAAGRDTLRSGARVVVEVPATSANLGPGFDCFGLALDWQDAIVLQVTDGGFSAEVIGEGSADVPTDERNLIISSARAGLADLGLDVPGLRVRSVNTIPHGRGLGSSSAAIVAGLAGAFGLAGLAGAFGLAGLAGASGLAGLAGPELDLDWVLRHAAAIEGHPDNVAAAVYGGFVLAYAEHGAVRVASVPLHPRLAAVAWVPSTPVATRLARGLLPASVPHADAAANSGRAALLVHAMSSAPELLLAGTRDWLHQSYRSSAMPASYDLVRRLRADGHAAVISGAGPAVLALTRDCELAGLLEHTQPGFAARGLRPARGVRLVERSAAPERVP
jgi:homoserine kinase